MTWINEKLYRPAGFGCVILSKEHDNFPYHGRVGLCLVDHGLFTHFVEVIRVIVVRAEGLLEH